MPTNSLPTHVTLTGVDDQTDLAALAVLSERFPLVEWGFLYSPKRQGNGGRYPSVETLNRAFQALPRHVRVALHICGAGVPGLLDAEPVVTALVQAVADRGGRVQLNFNQKRDNINLDALCALLGRFPGLKIITQHNESNESVWKACCGEPNYHVLFDASGGQGIECSAWPAPFHGFHCGFAGGLGPDNLAKELPRIREAARGNPYWIDMEGKLRSADDVFDLARAETCLREAVQINFADNECSERDLDRTISVRLSMRDLIILLWGAESVRWEDPENIKEWDAATDKLFRADAKLRARIAQG